MQIGMASVVQKNNKNFSNLQLRRILALDVQENIQLYCFHCISIIVTDHKVKRHQAQFEWIYLPTQQKAYTIALPKYHEYPNPKKKHTLVKHLIHCHIWEISNLTFWTSPKVNYIFHNIKFYLISSALSCCGLEKYSFDRMVGRRNPETTTFCSLYVCSIRFLHTSSCWVFSVCLELSTGIRAQVSVPLPDWWQGLVIDLGPIFVLHSLL